MKKLPVVSRQLPVKGRTADLHPVNPKPGLSGTPAPNWGIAAPQGRLAIAQDEVLGHDAAHEPVPKGRLDGLRRVLSLLEAALREIFDENAYTRFLQRHALQPSRAAYAEFLRENARARERRPRCC